MDLIDQRNLTMQLVFQCLVRRQRDYLLQDAPLAVCRLKEVAEETGLHLSTVSRACAHKYYEFNGRIRPFADLLCKALHQILSLIHISTACFTVSSIPACGLASKISRTIDRHMPVWTYTLGQRQSCII